MSQIRLTYQGNPYVLEFNRKTVKALEDQGFVLEDVTRKVMTMLPMLFRGAFMMHHKYIKPETVDAIFAHITKKDDLLGKLAEMYAEPYNALLDEPDEGDEGKVEWSAT